MAIATEQRHDEQLGSVSHVALPRPHPFSSSDGTARDRNAPLALRSRAWLARIGEGGHTIDIKAHVRRMSIESAVLARDSLGRTFPGSGHKTIHRNHVSIHIRPNRPAAGQLAYAKRAAAEIRFPADVDGPEPESLHLWAVRRAAPHNLCIRSVLPVPSWLRPGSNECGERSSEEGRAEKPTRRTHNSGK